MRKVWCIIFLLFIIDNFVWENSQHGYGIVNSFLPFLLLPFAEGALIASSKLEQCVNTGEDDLKDCKMKFVIALTVDKNQVL